MTAATAPLRIAIVDDEQPARNRLRELLADCAAELPNEVVLEAVNGLQALAGMADCQPDVALLDIHMPGMSGIELARHLQQMDRPPAIIFITAHDQHAVSAFEVNAIDYLLKPVRAVRLAAALRKHAGPARAAGPAPATADALAGIDAGPRQYLSVAERGKVLLVPLAEVLFLKADAKYVSVRTATAEHLIEESLSHLEEEFAAQFLRIHRNCLVARAHLRGVERVSGSEGEGWAVILEGWPEKLPVSRRQWPQVKELVRG
jgi:two-component system response regulator AlgR